MRRLHARTALLVLALSLLLPGPLRAAPRAAVSLALDPRTASPGGVVLVTGHGFLPGEPVSVRLDGLPPVSATADAGGVLPVTGLVIAAAEPPGLYPVVARGLRSGRAARALLTIAVPTPSLQVRSGPAQPGAAVAVHGAGFLPREQIALALNGSALAVAHALPGRPGLVSGLDGRFDTVVIAPANLLAGANSLAATGSISHRTALAQLIGRLPIRSDFLFAGAATGGGQRAVLALLNAGGLPAAVRVTLLPLDAGATGRAIEATLPPAHGARIDLLPLAGPDRRFGLRVQADRRIASQLLLISPSSRRSIAPATEPRNLWLLAEGFTGLTFHETLTILNPNRASARVRILFSLPNGRSSRGALLIAPPLRELEVDANAYAPRSSVAAQVAADLPVVVGRTLRFGRDGSGAATSLGSPTASSTWLFADGSTEARAQTFLTVLNPGAAGASVTASFYDDQGRLLANHTLLVEGRHRATVLINRLFGPRRFATFVTASSPVVVERPIYLGDPNGARAVGSGAMGSNGPSPVASFADGEAGPGTLETIVVLNPTAHTARVALTAYPCTQSRWRAPIRTTLSIPPLARRAIDVSALLRRAQPGGNGTVLRALNGVGFVAEQAIYTVLDGSLTMRSSQAQ